VIYYLVTWWGPQVGPCWLCGLVAWLDGGPFDCVDDDEED